MPLPPLAKVAILFEILRHGTSGNAEFRPYEARRRQGKIGSHTVAASSMVRDGSSGCDALAAQHFAGISSDTWPLDVIPITAKPMTIVDAINAS